MFLSKAAISRIVSRTHAPTHTKATCCHVALKIFKTEMISIAYVRVSALFHVAHTPAWFAAIQLNIGVVLTHYGISGSRSSPKMMVTCVFGGLYPKPGLARQLQGRCPGVFQSVEIGPPTPRRTFTIGALWAWSVLMISWDRIGLETQDLAHLFSEVATAIVDSVGQRIMPVFFT